MKKKLLLGACGLFMSLAVAMSASQMDAEAAVVTGICGENITWEYNEATSTLKLTGSGAMVDSNYVGGPWQSYEKELKSVVVGEGITTIGDYAFYSLDVLENIDLPKSIISIGDHSFASTNIVSMELPENLVSIGENAFGNCRELIDMELPEGIQFLGRQAFAGCENLENVDIPSSVKEIEAGIFQGCSKLESVVIPEGITSIPSYLFGYCQSLRSVVLPDSVTTIGRMAFEGCYSLQKIDIPDGVTDIGMAAFQDCKRLTEVMIPKGVIDLRPYVFNGCVALAKVSLPNEMTAIHYNAFQDCKALTNIILPEELTYLAYYTFDGCTRLTSIHLPEKLENIYNNNFTGAENLFRMTIDSRAVLRAIADPELDEQLLEYPKTVYIKSDINDELNLTQYGYSKAGQVTKDGKQYIIYTDHVHNENNCVTCMNTGIEFTDVKTTDYFYSPVIWAADEGVTSGLTASLFGPNAACTRAQVVTFLWRAEGRPEATETESFTDVSADAYYYDAVHWAAANGITYGYGNGKFGSEDVVTRAQFVSFLWRLRGKQKVDCENPFKDLSKDAYYYDAVLWAVEKGITAGLYPDQFAPNATCTRGQVVSFIFRTGQWDVDQLKIVFPG